mmetsp:Transcript_75993/g.222762  ORF Transcript_75993/g.222762 Transcript_75993/m.222762 type:complete len:273 (+) Transcript_75993:37-855(+)
MLGSYLLVLTCLQALIGPFALRVPDVQPPQCLGWREAEVWKNAVNEAGLKYSNISSFGQCVGKVPASWVRQIDAMGHNKTIRYNFQGSAFAKDVQSYRRWVWQFVTSHFGPNDYFRVTDATPTSYLLLGSFDKTKMPGAFRPKDHVKNRKTWTSLSPGYFRVLTSSNFTLCPRGDRAFSYRFYEAALSYSIPVLKSLDVDLASTVPVLQRSYPQMLRCIGYKYYTLDDGEPLVYRKDWAEENHRLFIKYQTFIEGDNTPPNCPKVRNLAARR